MNVYKLFLTLLLTVAGTNAFAQELIDKKATAATKSLYESLHKLSESHTLFAHQHATEYGHGWRGDKDRSDVKSVCGSHPAMIGVDLMDFTGHAAEEIEKHKEKLKQNVVATYNRGGITTVTWHFSNPLSAGGFYWKDSVSVPAVRHLIPGGYAHETYKAILDHIGEWAHSLKGKNGQLVPVIFRPYHEFDGYWFWWGANYCTPREFTTMWKFTVSYLRDHLKVHNFIYAFSPDNTFKTEAQFLDRYPGDEWVDMVGMDNYGDMGRDRYQLDTAALKLKIVADYAAKKGKLAAFTETGLESIPDTTWWTETLLKTMRHYDIKLTYVLVWRNDEESPKHYYAPFPGQVSVSNFLEFYNDPHILFEKDLDRFHLYDRRWWKFWLKNK